MKHHFPCDLASSMAITSFLVAHLLHLGAATGPIYLRANGEPDTYALINSVFEGNAIEVPDCGHETFGPHITQEVDGRLGRHVFTFHVHVNEDNDRCSKFDRQRTEIKPHYSSTGYLKGFEGDTVTLSWNFRINSSFLPAPSFTHIHQLKATDGVAAALGLIALTPRRTKLSGNVLELIHVDSHDKSTKLMNVALSSVAGKWIHVREQITYDMNGKFSIAMTELETGAQIMTYTNDSIDMWRQGASHVRPKWGIYRSLKHKSQLKDEQVGFDTFCLAKGENNCM